MFLLVFVCVCAVKLLHMFIIAVCLALACEMQSLYDLWASRYVIYLRCAVFAVCGLCGVHTITQNANCGIYSREFIVLV